MKKFGIKRTKMNIFWLLMAGLLIGVVLGLRQPMPSPQVSVATPQQTAQEVQK